MIDLITYCADTAALITELVANHPDRIYIDDEGGASYLVSKTPTRRNSNKTLALVRCVTAEDETDLRGLTCLQVLGTYDEVFADPALLAIYDSVYSRASYQTTIDGSQVTVTPPEKFGVFA